MGELVCLISTEVSGSEMLTGWVEYKSKFHMLLACDVSDAWCLVVRSRWHVAADCLLMTCHSVCTAFNADWLNLSYLILIIVCTELTHFLSSSIFSFIFTSSRETVSHGLFHTPKFLSKVLVTLISPRSSVCSDFFEICSQLLVGKLQSI
jgi:hypothetical protein